MTKWLNAKGAAAHLGVSERTIWRLIKEEGLPSSRPSPRRVTFHPDQLDAWMVKRGA